MSEAKPIIGPLHTTAGDGFLKNSNHLDLRHSIQARSLRDMMKIDYLKKHDDGSVETLIPHRYSDGSYKVEISVSENEMREWAEKGANVRMSGPRTKSPSIVPPTIRV